MAVTINTNQMDFFQKVLAQHPTQLGKALALSEIGVSFEIELYCIKAKYKGAGWMLNLKSTTSTLMKTVGSATKVHDPAVTMAVNQIAQFMDDLYEKTTGKAPGQPLVTPVPAVPNVPLGELMDKLSKSTAKPIAQVHDSLVYGKEDLEVAPAPAAKSSKTPVIKPGIIKLVDAEAIGQQVKGTSGGSIYRLIAANARMKIAARIQGTQVSIRAEWLNPTSQEMAALKASGIAMHQGYASMHMEASGLPIPRVIGAYLYGTGIKFDRVLTPGEEMPA